MRVFRIQVVDDETNELMYDEKVTWEDKDRDAEVSDISNPLARRLILTEIVEFIEKAS